MVDEIDKRIADLEKEFRDDFSLEESQVFEHKLELLIDEKCGIDRKFLCNNTMK